MPRRCVLTVLLATAALLVAGCQPGEKQDEKAATPAAPALTALEVIDTTVGTGPEAETGDLALVQYKGSLISDGTVFDENTGDSKAPFAFRIGQGAVIRGWDEGLVAKAEAEGQPGHAAMRVGGKRTLRVPAAMAYGEQGSGQIPANADLEFEITLLGLVKKGEEGVYAAKDIVVGTGEVVDERDYVTVHYKAEYLNGKMFDNTELRGGEGGTPVSFHVGGEGDEFLIIPGIYDGILGMRVGGVRELILPPALAFGLYGDFETGVEGNQVVKITLRLVSVTKK